MTSPPRTNAALPGPGSPFAFDANQETLDYLSRGFEEYGDVWAIPPQGKGDSVAGDGGLPVWVLNDPEAIHEILTRRQPDYGKGVGFERVKMLLGDGLIVSDGDHWRTRRRMLQPAFSRPSVGAMSALIAQGLEADPGGRSRPAAGRHADGEPSALRRGTRIDRHGELLARRDPARAPDVDAADLAPRGRRVLARLDAQAQRRHGGEACQSQAHGLAPRNALPAGQAPAPGPLGVQRTRGLPRGEGEQHQRAEEPRGAPALGRARQALQGRRLEGSRDREQQGHADGREDEGPEASPPAGPRAREEGRGHGRSGSSLASAARW